ncbi:hypothetical protein FBZ94_102364 [Bradyrhizobium sacchari]|uniref:Uncharacterized protein n=1 Tax=Bradyrhizobium sacchari TaxID=1399419 RepID=A0A560KD99_9BRAD|nr:hypothetical protein FBZ94_102364 [Bradyrhizobium sacchari]TWB81146.1 hypothetical protein FBZ95_102364 [Bradyrhizobium sacchari]
MAADSNVVDACGAHPGAADDFGVEEDLMRKPQRNPG